MVANLLRLFMINLSNINTFKHTTAPSQAANSCHFVFVNYELFPIYIFTSNPCRNNRGCKSPCKHSEGSGSTTNLQTHIIVNSVSLTLKQRYTVVAYGLMPLRSVTYTVRMYNVFPPYCNNQDAV